MAENVVKCSGLPVYLHEWSVLKGILACINDEEVI